MAKNVRDRGLVPKDNQYRKWPAPSRMVMWPTTLRDPKMSNSWPQYAYNPISPMACFPHPFLVWPPDHGNPSELLDETYEAKTRGI